MTVYVAKSKETFSHYLLRIVPSDRVDRMPDGELPKLVNGLSGAKSHKQLLRVIDGCCLLFGTAGSERQPNRVMTADECLKALESQFAPTDAKKLTEEMFLYSPRGAYATRANNGKVSPVASSNDAYSCGLTKDLEKCGDDERVIVEPVQDWMTVRNTLSLAASLLAKVEAEGQDSTVLEDSGFLRFEQNAYGSPVLAAPIKYHTFFGRDYAGHFWKASELNLGDLDYLYSLYYKGGHSAKGKNQPCVLGSDGDVFIATRYLATQNGISILDALRLPVEANRNLYLCVKERGSQVDMAKRILEALWDATQNRLRDLDGRPLGITTDESCLFDPDADSLAFRQHSLISRLWSAVFLHGGRSLVACKYCGCGVLGSKKGPAREFCSDSCRVQYRSRLNV